MAAPSEFLEHFFNRAGSTKCPEQGGRQRDRAQKLMQLDLEALWWSEFDIRVPLDVVQLSNVEFKKLQSKQYLGSWFLDSDICREPDTSRMQMSESNH